ncbi:MAG: SDR family oxidoreductase [Actinobacteria bacterium]|nr:SDR family oxidoreductase [Actinomycetota bacterium]
MKDKVVLVTGAATGIGRAIAEEFCIKGCTVVVNDISKENIQRVEKEFTKRGYRTYGLMADVTIEQQIKDMINNINDHFGRLDILVNNAGVTAKPKYIEEITLAEWESIIRTNLTGLFLCCKYSIPIFKRQRSGKIINIASLSGKIGATQSSVVSGNGKAHYAASKAGVINFTKALARELSPFGVNVNAVAPGPVLTDLIIRQYDGKVNEEALASNIPLKRLGTAGDVASTVLFLASEGAGYITGHILDVNGGLYMD